MSPFVRLPIPDKFSHPAMSSVSPRKKLPAPVGSSDALWNLLTLLALLGIVGVVAFTLQIYTDPGSPYNPFPPVTEQPLPTAISLADLLSTPSVTPTRTVQATATFTASPNPLETATHTPTPLPASATSTVTATAVPYTETPRPTALGGFAFAVQPGSPAAIPYSVYSDLGCNWLGIGGQVLGLDGNPITPGVTVRLRGTLNGRSYDITTLSGTATQYGASGFEFYLGSKPLASQESLYVQLLDQSGIPMSERVYVSTYDDCQRNLVLIRFGQIR